MNSIIPTEKVRSAFSKKQVQQYNKWAYPQKQTAKQLAIYYNAKLHNDTIKNFLDAGSGTGFLTQYLINLYPDRSITGLDISKNIIEEYKKINDNSTCIANMEDTPFPNSKFDATLSSFSIHWTDVEKTIRELTRITKYHIAFSVPIKGSLPEFNFPFYEKERIINITQKYCPHIDIYTEKINIPYKGLDLVKYFHYTGVSNLNPHKPIKKLMKKTKLQDFVQKHSQKELYYIVLYVIARL